MHLVLLILHVSGGTLGLLSGTGAMVFRKGSNRHRSAGDVFVISMIVMGVAGTWLALMKHQMNNVFGGILAVYLVATAWSAGRRDADQLNLLDRIAPLAALVVGVSMTGYGIAVATGRLNFHDGVPTPMYFVLGSIALLSAAGDTRMILRRGLSTTQRIARHVWRMCFALFIATGSLFLGQQQVFPAFLRGSNLLVILGLLPLPLMIFWLIRVRFAKAYRGKPVVTEFKAAGFKPGRRQNVPA
jgi:hypothetical protein